MLHVVACCFLLWLIRRMHRAIGALFLGAATLCAQAPVVPAGGVVNGASFRPSTAAGGGVAPGSIIAIFGTNLSADSQAAIGLPLPISLGGTSVTIAGKQAPLFYVSPNQINAQLPFSVPAGTAPLTVTTAKGTSAAVSVSIADSAPGLFAQSASGRGPGAVLNYVEQTAGTVLNTPAATISPGGIVLLYGTGLGAVDNPPADGAASAGQKTRVVPVVSIGGRQAVVEFAGLAPGLAGLYQVNARVPADAVEGCYVPVQVQAGSAVSNTITVAVNKTRKQCNSAAPLTGSPGMTLNGSVALAGLTRFSVQLALPIPFPIPLPAQPDLFTASFQRFPTKLPSNTVLPPVNGGCIVSIDKASGDATSLPDLDLFVKDKPLDAGTLTLASPSGKAQTITPKSPGEYQLDLGTSGLTAGAWTLTGAGGTDVGPFTAKVTVPGTFRVTSFGLRPDGSFRQSEPLQLAWTCPDASGQVTAAVMSVDGSKGVMGLAYCSFACSPAKATMPADVLAQLPASGQGQAHLLLLLGPAVSSAGKIAPTFGLDQGWLGYELGSAAMMATLTP